MASQNNHISVVKTLLNCMDTEMVRSVVMHVYIACIAIFSTACLFLSCVQATISSGIGHSEKVDIDQQDKVYV